MTTRASCWRNSSTRDTLRYLRDFRFGGDIDGYAEGELYFPGSPVLSVTRQLRRMRGARDAGAVDLQPRHRDRVRGGAHGQRGRGTTADRDGVTTHPRTRRRRRGPRRLHRRLRRVVQPGGPAPLRDTRRRAPPRTRSPCCTHATTDPTNWPHFAPRSTRSGVDTTLLVDTYDVTTGVANAVAAAGTGLGAVRIDSGELGVLARQVREQLDQLGATQTRIVVSGDLDEFSIAGVARRAGGQLRRRHVAGHRLGRPDREHGLQAGRSGRHAGTQAQHPQGIPRRPQRGAAPVPPDRHRSPRRSCIRRAVRPPPPSRPGC